MKLISVRSKIRGIPARWRAQYPENKTEKGDQVFAALSALNLDAATPDDIRKIIGNDSWTHDTCGECGKWFTEGVEVGRDTTLFLCCVCAQVAGKGGELLTENK